MTEERAPRFAAAITWLTALLFFAIAFLLAVVIPIHAQDALTFGEWSRLIAGHWHLHYAAATAQEYGRPLFYVLQGWFWGVFGFDETSGRILSGLFSVLLLGALVWLIRDREWGRLAGLLAAVALLATPVFAEQVVSGLTDIPAAALVALAGAFVWRRRAHIAGAVAAGLAAALAMLAKPSAFLALVGLALSQLIVNESWRSRLVYRVAPLGVGIGAGLAYDYSQARYVHQGLQAFMQAGVNTPYYNALADASRRYALLDGNWFGDGLRTAAFFALTYTVLRLLGVPHRLCVLIGVPFAVLGSWLGPWVAAHQARVAVGALHSAGAAMAAIGTAAFLALGAIAYRSAVASRAELARLVIWALPTAVAWAAYGAYDFRLLAPAWPPLLALVVLAALPAAAALARRGALALAIPFALVAIVVAENVYNLDGLGRSGWDQLRRTGDWLDRGETRAIVLPALSRTLAVVRRELGPKDLLISPEGAFRFYFPGRVEQSFPNSCNDVHRFRVFVLLTDEGSKRYMEDFLHVSGEPSYWAACQKPHLKQLTDGSEGYAVFRVRRMP
jgi:4-amino-4-deoxy-L-arabinose transferase-like glycosyltransferase